MRPCWRPNTIYRCCSSTPTPIFRWPSSAAAGPGSIAAVRREQATFTRTAAGYAWVARCIAAKIGRQRALLLRLAEQPAAPPGFAADAGLAGRVLTSLEREFSQWPAPAQPWDETAMQRCAERFRGQEGTASRLYFQQLGKYLAGHGWAFSGRQQHPAYEPFNALLNYLYGMGYTAVHLALLKSGLDPYMGVLHADQWGARPTLAYDAIEPYRPWADEVAARTGTQRRFDAGRLFSTRSGRAWPVARPRRAKMPCWTPCWLFYKRRRPTTTAGCVGPSRSTWMRKSWPHF